MDQIQLQQLGDYVITGTLASGGMGQVFRAVHRLMGREVAIKALKSFRAADPGTCRRFEREVRTLARLTHPNVVTAFDAREEQGILYLVTELIEGEDLAHLVARQGPIPPLEAMDYIRQAALGLRYAHAQGIVHRDVKPSNLLRDEDHAIKVLDLGLARLRDDVPDGDRSDSGLTQSGQFLGTALFMSPEQARSPVDADERSDVYSLGCTLYFLLTGHPPFQSPSTIDTIVAHLQQPPPSLLLCDAGGPIPCLLDELLQRMMAKSPNLRPSSMQQVIQELDRILHHEPDQVALPVPVQRVDAGIALIQGFVASPTLAGPRRRRRTLLLGSLGALTLGGAAYLGWYTASGPRRPTDPPLILDPSGVVFDGETSYAQVEQFDASLATPFRMEAAVRPIRQYHPGSLIAWTGSKSGGLFASSDGDWGVAYFDGQDTHMVVGIQPIRFDHFVLVAGEWDGKQLQLFLDGEPIATRSIYFPLRPSNPGLFVGGSPEGTRQPNLGNQHFKGLIAAARVECGKLSPRPARTLAELRTPTRSSIVCFAMDEGKGERLLDGSRNRRKARLFFGEWQAAKH
jgi:hypothetical protein